MDLSLDIDIEHNRILEQLPMYALLGFFGLMALPIIPNEIKSPIILVGLLIIFVFMFASGPIAQFIASQYIPIKARIRPYNVEKTFFCRKPIGMITSDFNETLGIFTTPFKLAFKTLVEPFGYIDGILLESVRAFEERNVGSEIYVMFMGQEVKVARGILVDLWVTEEDPTYQDFNETIMRFELAAGEQDFNIVMKNRQKGYCGRYDLDLKNYSNGIQIDEREHN